MREADYSRRTTLGGLLGAAALAAMPRAVLAARPLVRLSAANCWIDGRTAIGTNGALRIGYPGVALNFTASSARAALAVTASSGDCWIDVAVDDGTPRVVHLAAGPQAVELFAGAAGVRRIQILKRTESWQGTIDVMGVAGLDRVNPVPAPARRMTFIGDSITCGAGADVPDANSTRESNENNNGAKSFGRVLAARLGSQCHLVSYGGRGMIRDWQGIRNINNAPVFYERAMPDDPTALWDHASYVPHAIGVCLGTNDFNQGVPDQNEFTNGYVEFLRKLMRDAPAAHVFVIDSPMTTDNAEQGHRRTILGDYLDEIVARIASPLVTRANIARYPGRAANVHPIAAEHVKIADELEPRYRAALRWS